MELNHHISHLRVILILLLLLSFGWTNFAQAQVSPFDQKHKLSKDLLSSAPKEVVPPPISPPVQEEITDIETETATTDDARSAEDNIEAEVKDVNDTKKESAPEISMTTENEVVAPPSSEEEQELVVSTTSSRTKNQPLFLFLMLIAATILTTLTISSNKSLVNNLLRAVLNDNYLNLMYREQKKTGTFHYYILYFVFAVNAGLFLYFLMSRLFFADGIPLLWQCVLLVGLVYGCRHLFMNYIAYVYTFHKEVEQYAFTILIFNIFLGLLLLPINVFIAFSPEPIGTFFLYGGIIIALIVYVFRQLRGVFISSRLLVNNKFYFLLYLCAVEIAPLLLLVKYSGAYVS